MNERTIDQIIADIAGYERIAGTELDAVHPNVRPSFELAIREATENLTKAREDYRSRVFSQAVAFFMSGDREKVKTFAALAPELGNVFVVDAGALYEHLADRVEPTIGRSREFSVNQLTELVLGLRDVAVAAGLKGTLQAPRLQDLRAVQNREELVAYVRELVTAAMGDSLNSVHLTSSILSQALARKFTGAVLAAVITNAPPEAQPILAQPFATKTDVVIAMEDEVDEAYVLKVFEMGKRNRPPKRR